MKTIWAKSLETLWEEDKARLKRVRPKVRMDYSTPLTDAARCVEQVKDWVVDDMQRKTRAIDIDVIKNLCGVVANELELVTGLRLETRPAVEVVDPVPYFNRVDELLEVSASRCNMKKNVSAGVSVSYWIAGVDTLVFPAKAFGEVLSTAPKDDVPYVTMIVRGEKEFYILLKEHGTGSISYSVARAVVDALILEKRGERGVGYGEAMRSRGDDYRRDAMEYRSILGCVFINRAIERNPSWAPYAIYERMRTERQGDAQLLIQGLDAIVDAEGAQSAVDSIYRFTDTNETKSNKTRLRVDVQW